MSSRRAIALLVLATVVGLTIAPIASGTVLGAINGDESTDETGTNTTVATFMQASSADAENAVDARMFEAEYESADNESKDEVVTERTDELEDRLEALETEREALRDQRDEISHGQYRSRMAKLTVKLTGLERAIEQTRSRAAETGVDEKRLETLRKNASELAGQEVAEMAREMAGHDRVPGQGPPDDSETGPPDDKGSAQGDQENTGSLGQTDDTGDDDAGGSLDDTSGTDREDDDEGET